MRLPRNASSSHAARRRRVEGGRLRLSAKTCTRSSYLEVECGTVVTEESPEQMIGPLHLFLRRLAQSGIGV